MELTYSFPGITREPGSLPAGFRLLSRRGLLGTGDAVFTAAAARVRHWDMFRAAGLRVRVRGATERRSEAASTERRSEAASTERRSEAASTERRSEAASTERRSEAASTAVAEGADVAVGLGIGPVRLWAPCRVVWVIDEPNRYGFGYGTLPGHPVCGEEAFIVEREADGRVWFEVRAISRPAAWYARLGGPLNRSAQRWAAGRYVRGLRRLVAAQTDPDRPNSAG